MRILLSAIFLLFCAWGEPSGDKSVAATEQEVLARVSEFAEAFRAADVERLSAMLAANYAHTNAGSKSITRDQWLAYIKSRKEELRTGALHITRYENRDLEVRLHGETAVVTGVNQSSGTRNGAPFALELRFTQVWRRDKGVWLRIAFHDTPAVP